MPAAIVSTSEMINALKRYVLGESLTNIAKDYNVSKQALSERLKSKTFKPVLDEFITSLINKATDDVVETIETRLKRLQPKTRGG